MYEEIYIDIVFLTNLVMDYILLCIVGIYFRCRKSRGRYLASSAVGALFSCMITGLGLERETASVILLHGACAVLMLVFGLGLKKGSLLLKGILSLYLTAFLIGGFWEAVQGPGMTPARFVLLASGTYMGLTSLVYLFETRKAGRKNIYPITVSYQGNARQTYGFYDTGNMLVDPLSKQPVSVLEPELLENILPYGLTDKLIHLKDDPGEEKDTDFAVLRPHFLIYKTVGREGMLVAVTLEELCIHTPEEVVHIKRPVFALALDPFTFGKEYKVLLNSRLFY